MKPPVQALVWSRGLWAPTARGSASNSRECVVENAFGDRYRHSLSPAHPDVREYLVALATDVASHGPGAIELESFGYLAFRHGFHHE